MRTHAAPIRSVRYWFEAGELDMDQPYQRGHVWDEHQRLELVRSLFQGVPLGAVYLNRRGRADRVGYRVVDGKQRLTAINDYLTGALRFPAAWVDPADIAGTPGPDGTISHDDLAVGFRRALEMENAFAVHETELHDEAAERDLFNRINFTGTPMSDQDRAST